MHPPPAHPNRCCRTCRECSSNSSNCSSNSIPQISSRRRFLDSHRPSRNNPAAVLPVQNRRPIGPAENAAATAAIAAATQSRKSAADAVSWTAIAPAAIIRQRFYPCKTGVRSDLQRMQQQQQQLQQQLNPANQQPTPFPGQPSPQPQ